MSKLYLVSFGAQKKEIDEYCFGKCGQIFIGAVDFMGGMFLPCRTEDCKFLEKAVDMGKAKMKSGRVEHIEVRKLKSLGGKFWPVHPATGVINPRKRYKRQDKRRVIQEQINDTTGAAGV